ncbi:phosphoethanolamine transferase CptA [Paenibacillus endoradicis]|uniref:phosphoethanolamine transferase CptA n=1 Tax=Paenibacillus endoradicis TaxID=2972487 RepID=UPI002158BDDC|nr:phosphoethanolamine transferase CptA [Paenibacillus endoradicis]MCR8659116.1 phosphoethanolamine transferase CptA [Paenibacillus endoradicis]
MDPSISLIFIIVAFSLGAVLVLKKDTIPTSMKRWLSIFAILMILFAFFIIIDSLLKLGT